MRATFQVTRMFFDRRAVLSRVDAAAQSVLSRFGAYVRQVARTSIRFRKKPSEPGKPPSSHTGLLKRFIFFSYEPRQRSVVIGPARLNKAGDAPHALEHGGRSVDMAGLRGARRPRARFIRARPYMRPAFDQVKPQLPDLWAGSVR